MILRRCDFEVDVGVAVKSLAGVCDRPPRRLIQMGYFITAFQFLEPKSIQAFLSLPGICIGYQNKQCHESTNCNQYN